MLQNSAISRQQHFDWCWNRWRKVLHESWNRLQSSVDIFKTGARAAAPVPAVVLTNHTGVFRSTYAMCLAAILLWHKVQQPAAHNACVSGTDYMFILEYITCNIIYKWDPCLPIQYYYVDIIVLNMLCVNLIDCAVSVYQWKYNYHDIANNGKALNP